MPTGMNGDYEMGHGKPRGIPVSRRASPATRAAAGVFEKPSDLAEQRLFSTGCRRMWSFRWIAAAGLYRPMERLIPDRLDNLRSRLTLGV